MVLTMPMSDAVGSKTMVTRYSSATSGLSMRVHTRGTVAFTLTSRRTLAEADDEEYMLALENLLDEYESGDRVGLSMEETRRLWGL